jgi:hypothetical protein
VPDSPRRSIVDSSVVGAQRFTIHFWTRQAPDLRLTRQQTVKMGILRSLGIQAVVLIMYLILARRGRIEPKQHALNFGIWFIMSCGGRILGALGPGLVNIFGILFFVVMARLYWLFFERSRNTSIRNPDETCSLGVFMGSGKSMSTCRFQGIGLMHCIGGHTAEMKALVTTLDFNRYTPRTYVYCHGDEMSLRTITEIEATQPTASSSHLSVSLVSVATVEGDT